MMISPELARGSKECLSLFMVKSVSKECLSLFMVPIYGGSGRCSSGDNDQRDLNHYYNSLED